MRQRQGRSEAVWFAASERRDGCCGCAPRGPLSGDAEESRVPLKYGRLSHHKVFFMRSGLPRSTRSRFLALAGAVAATALLLTGCAGGGSNAPAAGGKAAAPAAAPAPTAITAVSPAAGSVSGANTVTLTGTSPRERQGRHDRRSACRDQLDRLRQARRGRAPGRDVQPREGRHRRERRRRQAPHHRHRRLPVPGRLADRQAAQLRDAALEQLQHRRIRRPQPGRRRLRQLRQPDADRPRLDDERRLVQPQRRGQLEPVMGLRAVDGRLLPRHSESRPPRVSALPARQDQSRRHRDVRLEQQQLARPRADRLAGAAPERQDRHQDGRPQHRLRLPRPRHRDHGRPPGRRRPLLELQLLSRSGRALRSVWDCTASSHRVTSDPRAGLVGALSCSRSRDARRSSRRRRSTDRCCSGSECAPSATSSAARRVRRTPASAPPSAPTAHRAPAPAVTPGAPPLRSPSGSIGRRPGEHLGGGQQVRALNPVTFVPPDLVYPAVTT